MIESGYPTFPQNAWSGVVAPAGTPAPIVARLNGAINDGLKTADAKASLMKFSAITQPGAPTDFAASLPSSRPNGPNWSALRCEHRVEHDP